MPDTIIILEMVDKAYRQLVLPLQRSFTSHYGLSHQLETLRRAPAHGALSEEYLTRVAQETANTVQCRRHTTRCGYIALKEIVLERGGKERHSVSTVLIIGADRKGFSAIRLFALGLDKLEVEAARAVAQKLGELSDMLLAKIAKRTEDEKKAAQEFVGVLMELFPSARPEEGTLIN